MLHCCRRGAENLRKLTKSHFEIRETNGIKCVMKIKDELTKNHGVQNPNQEPQIMAATGKENCPVESFIKYYSHLNPSLEFFFQRPKQKKISQGETTWYDNMVLGEKPLLTMMKKISKIAKLSIPYTNHCIRATTITVLDENDISSRHIMSLSGHRSENSLKSYNKTSNSMKRKMSHLLSGAASGDTDNSYTESNSLEVQVPSKSRKSDIQPTSSRSTENHASISMSDESMSNLSFDVGANSSPQNAITTSAVVDVHKATSAAASPPFKITPSTTMGEIMRLPHNDRLRELSKLRNFNFGLDISFPDDEDDADQCQPQQQQTMMPNISSPATKTQTKQRVRANFESLFCNQTPQRPIFYDCTFNFN